MTIDIEALKKAAEAATPGPWASEHHRVVTDDGGLIAEFSSTRGKYEWERSNRDYIAAVNPEAILALIAEVEQARAGAVVYPPDGTVAPFTVINLGHGLVKIGDAIHDGRLPALWFGKEGLGMGVEENMKRAAKEGETLAVITFANVEGLDIIIEVAQGIRSLSFPDAPQPLAAPADTDEKMIRDEERKFSELLRKHKNGEIDLSSELDKVMASLKK